MSKRNKEVIKTMINSIGFKAPEFRYGKYICMYFKKLNKVEIFNLEGNHIDTVDL